MRLIRAGQLGELSFLVYVCSLSHTLRSFSLLPLMPLRAKIVSNDKMSASALESQLAALIDAGKVPQAVVFAATSDGKVDFLFPG